MLPRFVFPPSTPLFSALAVEPPEHKFEVNAISTCDLGVGEKSYVLRVWNELLYFSTHPQNPQTPVWTAFEPVPAEVQHDEERLIEWWRSEVVAERFGVLQWTAQYPAQWDSSVIWGCNGRGSMRPWWDATGGEPFEWPDCHASSSVWLLGENGLALDKADLWFERWQMLDPFFPKTKRNSRYFADDENAGWQQLPLLSKEFGKRVLARLRTPRLMEDRDWQWRRGSIEECAALSKAVFQIEEELVAQHASMKCWFASRSRCQDAVIRFESERSYQRHQDFPRFGSRAHVLLDLLIADFAPIGWKWELAEAGRTCDRLSVVFDVSAPSQHERLESHLLLRGWLGTLVEHGDLNSQDADLLLEWPQHVRQSEHFRAQVLSRLAPPLWNN